MPRLMGMSRRIRDGLVMSLVVMGSAACSQGADPVSTATQTVIVSERTVTATPSPTAPTESPSPPATTTAPSVPAARTMPTTAGDYADGFVRAWGIGDRGTAERYATNDTVASLFAGWPRGGSTWKRTRSDPQDARTQVTYMDADRTTLYVVLDTATMARGTEDAIVGTTIEHDVAAEPESGMDGIDADDYAVTGLPTTVTGYADAFVRSWGVGDPVAGQYLREWVVEGLYGGGNGIGGPSWARTASTSTTATYTNSGDGSTMVITLDPDRVAAGRGDAIIAIDLR